MIRVLFSARDKDWIAYEPALRSAFQSQELEIALSRESAPEEVDYILYLPNGGLRDFGPFKNAKAVMSLWAGVEKVVSNPTLTQPLCRMVERGLTEGMTEWVVGHVLRYHLGIDNSLASQNGAWNPVYPPLARDRTVTILGLGELGRSAALALAQLEFNVQGWSRTQKQIPNVACFAGDAGLRRVLANAEILVLLLPQTAETRHILNATSLAALPRGARILNPGRGGLIDDAALLEALNSGQVAHATLDVFDVEPLPIDNPFWAHPNVTVTPHIASSARPATAAKTVAENIFRCENGQELLYVVDRSRSY